MSASFDLIDPMAYPEPVTLQQVSLKLPDGRELFANLSHVFEARRTGVVGRNGVGKSALAELIAGRLQPTSGQIRRPSVHYVSQQLDTTRFRTVNELAQLDALLAAIARIEAGSYAEADFAAVGERWDAAQRFEASLAEAGLAHVRADTPTAVLSGGEATRVALIGALMSDADVLLLDEPTNHLDHLQRERLYAALSEWPRTLIAIGHDRSLLRRMTSIVELTEQGLRTYGGNYDLYAAAKATEQAAAVAQLEHLRTTRRRWNDEAREQQERKQQRESRGKRAGRDANQAKILLGRQKQRSEHTRGRIDVLHAARDAALREQVAEARGRVEAEREVLLLPPDANVHASKKVLALDEVFLPYGAAGGRSLTFQLTGPERLGVVGPNGSGKSTLLRLLAGQVQPEAGRCEVAVPAVYLDQHAALLDADSSACDNLLARHPRMPEGEARTRLALIGLDDVHALRAISQLSGGERLKVALACVLYADVPAQLLLLDEPSNHLDLGSLEAVTRMLNQYRGALIVVSHDRSFLEEIGLTRLLMCSDAGWRTGTAQDLASLQ